MQLTREQQREAIKRTRQELEESGVLAPKAEDAVVDEAAAPYCKVHKYMKLKKCGTCGEFTICGFMWADYCEPCVRRIAEVTTAQIRAAEALKEHHEPEPVQ